jgi:hypothetical protein
MDPIPKGTDHPIVYQDLIRGVISTVDDVLRSGINSHRIPPVPGGPKAAIGGILSGLGGRLIWASS